MKTTEVKKLEGWQCIPGDLVRFVLKRGVPFTPGKFFWGVVKRRSKKTATIKSGQLERRTGVAEYTVHVSCIQVEEPVARIVKVRCGPLRRKFRSKPGQIKQKANKRPSRENSVGGMRFVY